MTSKDRGKELKRQGTCQADKSDAQLLQQLGCSGVLSLVTGPAALQGVLAGALQRIIQMEQTLDVLRLLVTSSASR